MKLVFIHGRAQEGKDPVKLKEEWLDTLAQGLAKNGLALPGDLEVALPFYGDELERLVKQVNMPLVDDIVRKGAEGESSEEMLRREMIEELAQANGIQDDEVQEHFSGTVKERGVLNWEWVQSILTAVDKTSFGSTAVDLFTRDVSVYLTYPPVQKKINSIVMEAIPDGPCVIVGHSLGSVVGYIVQNSLKGQTEVAKYITVGSPLGLKAIKRKLPSPLMMPPRTDAWYNAYDKRDFVALLPLDDKHFAIDPEISNYGKVRNDSDNRHSITGYLDDADVARTIFDALF